MDSALQVECDLSHALYIATANSIHALPTPLLDRLLVLTMPEPRSDDLAALLPSVCALIARAQGQDCCILPPLTLEEIADVQRHWDGGSVRRLRQVVEVVLGARDRFEIKH